MVEEHATADAYKVIIADDHSIVLTGLRSLISTDPMLKLVGEATDGVELMAKLEQVTADLVIIDLSMPKLSGLKAIPEINEKYPALKVVVLTMHKDVTIMNKVMRHKVSGYILKNEVTEKLLSAIKEVRHGNIYVSNSLLTKLFGHKDDVESGSRVLLDTLTERESQIVGMLAEGSTSKEIAKELGISPHTVSTHRANVMEKLGVNNVAELIKLTVKSVD